LSDPWADTEVHLANDSWSDSGNNLYGCLKQLYLLKKQNRNLKVLLSIGGWTYSPQFAAAVSTSQRRTEFSSSVISLISDLGFDGVEVDWEYPSNDEEASNMVSLLQEIRAGLDIYGNSLDAPYHFELTVACPGGTEYQTLHLADMDTYLDFWNLMAFDYTGAWYNVSTGDQANLFPSLSDPSATPFNTETAVNWYLSHSVPANKIVLGMPIYGRSFEATNGLGKPYTGVGSGTWEPGVYDFKVLPLAGAREIYDNETGSSYSYDTNKEELVSYDNIAVAKQKAAWIQELKLGGAMWWESSGDKVGSQSLIQNVVEVLGIENLEGSMNQLIYTNSTYDNLRAGMPELASSSSTTIVPAASQTSTSPFISTTVIIDVIFDHTTTIIITAGGAIQTVDGVVFSLRSDGELFTLSTEPA